MFLKNSSGNLKNIYFKECPTSILGESPVCLGVRLIHKLEKINIILCIIAQVVLKIKMIHSFWQNTFPENLQH